MQIHPLAYMVKLNIEMSMAELIAKVSVGAPNTTDSLFVESDRPKISHLHHPENKKRYIPIEAKNFNETESKLSNTFGTSTDVNVNWVAKSDITLDGVLGRSTSNDRDISMNMRREVHVRVERRNSLAPSFKHYRSSSEENGSTSEMEDQLKLLRKASDERNRMEENAKRALSGMDRQMGVHTAVWAPKHE